MLLFPAIDLRRGRCVRLRQGDPAAETIFGEDPAAIARRWVAQGATWLHVVNLDGALGDHDLQSLRAADLTDPDWLAALPANLRQLAAIRQAVGVPIQFGGGLRRLEDIAVARALGASRVVLGTAAVQNPALVTAALARFGAEQIVIGIDGREGRVATHGWAQTSAMGVEELAAAMAAAGVLRVVYTDIARDGMLAGVNVAATAALARSSGLRVIASGGVRDIEDIRSLHRHEAHGIEGAIVGQALYTGQLDLRQALVEAGS